MVPPYGLSCNHMQDRAAVRPPVGEDARGAGDARGPAQGTQAASRPGEERPGL